MTALILKKEFDDLYKINFFEKFSKEISPLYVFGMNEYAESIIENYKVSGIIDEFTNEKTFKEIPIINLSDVPNDALVVVVVVVGKPIIAEKIVGKYEFDYIDYYSLLKFDKKKKLKTIPFIEGSREDIQNNFSDYEYIYQKLRDKKSKNCLFNLVNFKYSLNIKYMRGFNYIPEKQYFEEFIELEENEVFVDAGGFDGETTIDFIKKSPKFKEIHIFEPLQHQFLNICNRVSNHDNIFVHNLGLSDKIQKLKFKDAGSASRITDDGEIEITVCNLDSFLDLQPTYIKMDIEGAEVSAINGAKYLINKYHPKLAICVYHKATDIREVFKSVLDIRADYHVYLRHYTEGIYETVMYFIPFNDEGSTSPRFQ